MKSDLDLDLLLMILWTSRDEALSIAKRLDEEAKEIETLLGRG